MKCPLEGVNGVWLFNRAPHAHSICHSLPGHLIHLILKGSYRLRIAGRDYEVEAGDFIYYYESESVECWMGDSEVSFYSAAFFSEAFEPLPVDGRVYKAERSMGSLFASLCKSYNDLAPGAERDCLCNSLLLCIMALIERRRGRCYDAGRDGAGGLWQRLEVELRRRRLFRPSLDELAAISGMSKSSVVRACRLETGGSPMERVRGIRMSEAEGLLKFASLNVGQVAAHLGYPRIHEFSREFRRHFGRPPSSSRKT